MTCGSAWARWAGTLTWESLLGVGGQQEEGRLEEQLRPHWLRQQCARFPPQVLSRESPLPISC